MNINKKSKAFKVPFIKPNVNIMFQIDFKRDDKKPKDPETNIHKFGCNFMCCCAIPQFVNNKKLSGKDILTVYYKALESKWMEYDCTVLDPCSVMTYAATLLGDTKHIYQNMFAKAVAKGAVEWGNGNHAHTSDLPGSNNVCFFIVDFLTGSSPEYGGHHFELFSSVGNLMYDPANCTVHKYRGVNNVRCWKVSTK